MMTLVGLLGGLCFAYCGVPAAWKTWRSGHSLGTPISIAWMIVTGSILMYAYLTVLHGFNPVLTVNYSVEAISWAVVIWFHYMPRSAKEAPGGR